MCSCSPHLRSRPARRSWGWFGRRWLAKVGACCPRSSARCGGSQPAGRPEAGCVGQSACCCRRTRQCAALPDPVGSPRREGWREMEGGRENEPEKKENGMGWGTGEAKGVWEQKVKIKVRCIGPVQLWEVCLTHSGGRKSQTLSQSLQYNDPVFWGVFSAEAETASLREEGQWWNCRGRYQGTDTVWYRKKAW